MGESKLSGRMVLYRGSLKSCSYHCSYCPFSKHQMSELELQKDREQWSLFVQAYENQGFRAMMVVPYGEALIHPWYWEGMAYMSALIHTDAVGAQTNLSFPIQRSLELFIKAGGVLEKLRIWATFHPQMVSSAEFARRCGQLKEAGVTLCAGAVGVPEHQSMLQQLRRELPDDIYMWINRMDGLRRAYTPQEEQAFLEIDPYFSRELLPHQADAVQCAERLFVEADGRIRLCNISRAVDSLPLKCSRKRCSCYLAYGGRNELMNQVLFGPYPLFRIPRRAKAVFLDIEGTLLSAEPDSAKAGLQALSREQIPVFFATTMPYEDAVRRCHAYREFFSGGVFAAGAHLRMERDGEIKERFFYLEEMCIAQLELLKQKMNFRILEYRNQGRCFKLTLLRPLRMPWKEEEADRVFCHLPDLVREKLRYFVEKNCLQIVAAGVDKAAGVTKICHWLGISPREAFAAGDSKEDVRMINITFDK